MLEKLYLPKWCEVLIKLYELRPEERICQNISRKAEVSHTHIKNSLKQLEENGFVKIVKRQQNPSNHTDI